jgi:DNA-binding NarL/FixJ family response regulator
MTRKSDICRLVLAESYPILLEGMRRTFSADPAFHVLACCRSGIEALHAVREHQPDVLVLDLRIAREGAFEVLRDLRGRRTACRVVLLADWVSEGEIAEATRLGVKGVVLKTTSAHHLVESVKKVRAGAMTVEGISTSPKGSALQKRLTPRQFEIAKLIADGCTNAEIAERLAITEGTVKTHLHTLYKKLGLGGRLELALYAANWISLKHPPRPAA